MPDKGSNYIVIMLMILFIVMLESLHIRISIGVLHKSLAQRNGRLQTHPFQDIAFGAAQYVIQSKVDPLV